jgi:hypothetical protein
MSSRERWIVYPLLFLALGLTMRPKLGEAPEHDQVYFGDIHCRTINGQRVADFEHAALPRQQPRIRRFPPPLTPPEASASHQIGNRIQQ